MAIFYESLDATLHVGDCLDVLSTMPAESVQTCITSPPYWGLRDYGHADQLGQESTPEEYVASMVSVFREVRRVLAKDGTLWLNLGDSYASETKGSGGTGKSTLSRHTADGLLRSQRRQAMEPRRVSPGLPPKNLIGIPWRVAFALQADGWILRADIIWHKTNPMPESVRDRPTKAHEYVFLLSKSERYFYDAAAVSEPARQPVGEPRKTGQVKQTALRGAMALSSSTLGSNQGAPIRNRRSVWTVATRPYRGAHFATFPEALALPCVLAGSRVGAVVLDPFNGAGTTGLVAMKHGRRYVGIELNPDYARLSMERWGAGIQCALTTPPQPSATG